MILFDSNKMKKWSGKGLSINKNNIVVYKNAKIRHKINLSEGKFNLRVFAKNRTGNSPINIKIIDEKNSIIFSEVLFLSKSWSEEKLSFKVKKSYTSGYILISKNGGYGSTEIGRILLEKDAKISKKNRKVIKGKINEIKDPEIRKSFKKKIGVVIPYGIYGGAEIYIKTILEDLNNDLIDIHILYLKNNPLEYVLNSKNIFHKKVSSKSNFINYIQNHQIKSLIYYNSISAYKLCQEAYRKSKGDIKLIEIYHSNFEWSDSLSKIKSRKNLEILFIVSANLSKNINGANRIIELPVPIDIDKFNLKSEAESKAKINIFNNNPVIGTVARLSEEKNIDYILDLSHNMKDFNFLIFGKGPKENHLRKRISQEKISNVHLLGFKKDIFRYYPNFDAFLLTSEMEGTPISILEAMSTGIPVFTTNVGEISSIIKDKETGFFIKKDISNDSDIIRQNFLNNEVSKNARKFIEENHEKEKISMKFLNSIIDIQNEFVKRNNSKILQGEYI